MFDKINLLTTIDAKGEEASRLTEVEGIQKPATLFAMCNTRLL